MQKYTKNMQINIKNIIKKYINFINLATLAYFFCFINVNLIILILI
jgi:hypothetical protein